MARVNDEGYVERRTKSGSNHHGKTKRPDLTKVFRDWWIVKWAGGAGSISMNTISLPKKYLGKKIRLKVEVVEDG